MGDAGGATHWSFSALHHLHVDLYHSRRAEPSIIRLWPCQAAQRALLDSDRTSSGLLRPALVSAAHCFLDHQTPPLTYHSSLRLPLSTGSTDSKLPAIQTSAMYRLYVVQWRCWSYAALWNELGEKRQSVMGCIGSVASAGWLFELTVLTTR